MSFLSKISLLALLASVTTLGMEQLPHLKVPATNTAIQASDGRIINITLNNHLIAQTQENYLRVSPTFKDMLEYLEDNTSFEMPSSMKDEFKAIEDLLAYEYDLQNTITENGKIILKNTIEEVLSKKTIEHLGTILNACQRFELNNLSPFVAKVLAHQLLIPANRNKCLTHGSYGFALTADTKKLILDLLLKEGNFIPHLATWLTFLYFDGLFEINHFFEIPGGIRNILVRCNSFSKIPFDNNTCFLSEVEAPIQNRMIFALTLSSERARDVVVSFVKKEGSLEFYYWHVAPFFHELYQNKLTIEQIALLHFALEKFEKNQTFSMDEFPKMQEILSTLPNYIQKALTNQSRNRILEFINSNTGRMSTAAAITTALGFGLYKWTQHK